MTTAEIHLLDTNERYCLPIQLIDATLYRNGKSEVLIDSLNFRQKLANRQAFNPGPTFEPCKVNLPVARESLLLDLSPIGIANGFTYTFI